MDGFQHLAKVRVAGSNPVVRSIQLACIPFSGPLLALRILTGSTALIGRRSSPARASSAALRIV